MPRIPNMTRDQLKPEDQKHWEEIVGSRGSVRGPYGILMHSPELAACVANTGTFVRFKFNLPESLKETVIIATAREVKQQYVFAAHARLARQAGVSEDVISAIATGKAPEGLTGDTALVVKYVQELQRNRKVSDATFKAVVDRFGVKDAVNLTGLIGHYLLVSQILTAFEVELGPDMKREIPD